MYLRTLEICVLIYKWTSSAKFFSAPGLAWQAALKKTKVKLDLLTDALLMVKKGMRGEICNGIDRYTKANKYMKDYDKTRASSYLHY